MNIHILPVKTFLCFKHVHSEAIYYCTMSCTHLQQQLQPLLEDARKPSHFFYSIVQNCTQMSLLAFFLPLQSPLTYTVFHDCSCINHFTKYKYNKLRIIIFHPIIHSFFSPKLYDQNLSLLDLPVTIKHFLLKTGQDP